MNAKDPVRAYLSDRGCSPQVIEGGVEWLIENWEKTVESVEEGYSLGLDDYLNDLDARQLIEDALPIVPEQDRPALIDRVQAADERMQEMVDMLETCLWGNVIAEIEDWNPDDNWWYYARPRNADPQLIEEIDNVE